MDYVRARRQARWVVELMQAGPMSINKLQHKGTTLVFHNYSVFNSNLHLSLKPQDCRMVHVGSSFKLLDGRLIGVITRNTKVLIHCWGLHLHRIVGRLDFIVIREEPSLLILEASPSYNPANKSMH